MGTSVWIDPYESQKGTKYRVCWRHNGERGSKKVGSDLRNAELIRNQMENGFILGNNQIVDNSRTVQHLYDEYMDRSEKTKRESTVRMIKRFLAKLLTKYSLRPLTSIAQRDIDDFKTILLKTHKSVNGVNMILRTIKALFQYGVEREYLEKSPAQKIKLEREVEVWRCLNKEEITKILFACRFSSEFESMVKVALSTGMRASEIINLHSSQIKADYIQVQGKTNKIRKIPIFRDIEHIVKNRSGRIFDGWCLWRLERIWQRAIRRANVGGRVRFHDLRHTFCSIWFENGGTEIPLAEITGHSDLKTLRRYTHFKPNDQKRRIDDMDFGFSSKQNLKVV